jgi:hypothetical protein
MLPTHLFRTRRMWLLLIIALFGTLLTACSPGGLYTGDMMYAPHRTLEYGAETLRSGLMALTEGDRSGQIRLSEAELSALLTAMLVDETNAESLIRDVQVWLEPDTVYLKLLLRDGALGQPTGNVAVNVEAGLRTEDGRLLLEIHRAGLGVIPILSPTLLDTLETQLHTQVGKLVNRSSPLDVTIDSGTMTIELP